MPHPAATRPAVRIEGESVILAPLGAEHATEQYASWLNDPTVNRYLETRSVTIPELRAYISTKNASDDALLLGIFWKGHGKDSSEKHANRSSDSKIAAVRGGRSLPRAESRGTAATSIPEFPKHIGNLKLEPIDRTKGTAVMGILIGDKTYWGRGVATEATNLIAEYAFGQLGLRELTLGVIAGNKAAVRVYEKCGFTVTEVKKNAMNHGGVLHDQICMRKCKMNPPAPALAASKEWFDSAHHKRIVSDPMELKRCSRCVMPETQEVISFDDAGVCAVCRNHEIKQHIIDWEKRKSDFLNLLREYRGKYAYDCIVPFSGGKDSTFTALSLVRDFGLKPLIVSFDHHLMRPKVLANRERTLRKLGADFIGFRPDWRLVKKMMRISLERKGDILWYQHNGIFAYPMQVAIRHNVPLVIWGEPSAEYTSYYDYDPNETEEVDETRFNMFVNLGITAEDMLGMINEHPKFAGEPPVTERDIAPYVYPKRSELHAIKCRSVCLGNFIPWDVKEQARRIREELGWEGDAVEGVPPEYHYEKIEDMMQGVQDYLKYIKRGYGRMSHLASIDIRNGRMTREKAMELLRQWEGWRPASLDVFLGWMGMSGEEFYEIASHHRVAPWKHDPKRTERSDELPDQKDWITG